MKSKVEWEQEVQKQGINAHLDNGVLILQTSDTKEAQKYRELMKDYPYSWGIHGKTEAQNDEGRTADSI